MAGLKKILLVDDEDEELDGLRRILRHESHFVASLSAVVGRCELECIALLIYIDKGVGVHLLEFGGGGRAHVHFVAAREERPLRFAVEPRGEGIAGDFELVALHIDVPVGGSVLLQSLELGAFEGGFDAPAVLEFGCCFVEHLSCRLCPGGTGCGRCEAKAEEYAFDGHAGLLVWE